MFRRVAGRPGLPRTDRAAQRRRRMSRRQRTIVARVISRKTNRRHMFGDLHGRAADTHLGCSQPPVDSCGKEEIVQRLTRIFHLTPEYRGHTLKVIWPMPPPPTTDAVLSRAESAIRRDCRVRVCVHHRRKW